MSLTRICVERDRVRLTPGLLRGHRVGARPGWTRIGLLASTALLLGGDEVRLEVTVGPGARLDLFDVAGTVAYHGRGRGASWHTRIELGEHAELAWSGEPLVVADGAVVVRTLDVDLGEGAVAWLRETIVLGRTGELGGQLRNTTSLRRSGRPVVLEDLLLEPALRAGPGCLGPHRVLDTVTLVGAGSEPPVPEPAVRFQLPDGAGSITRFLGSELARSPLRAWSHPVTEVVIGRETV